MSKLFNTLSAVLTPYANKINLHTEEIEEISGIKADLDNSYIGTDFEWELGTLTPNTGAELTGNTRIRSLFIPVSPGTKLIMTEPTSRLLVYCYNSSKGYVSDSPWLSTNEFTVPDGVSFVRILLRKNSSNQAIQESEINSITSDLTIEFPIPHNTYVDVGDLPKIKTSLSGTRYLPVELGTYTGGKPYNSTAYVRSMGFAFADIGDVLTVTPNSFNVYNGALYKYSVNNVSGYYGSVTIPTVNTGNKWRYVFTEKCWFCFRMSNASSGANIGLEDLYKFDNIIKLEHIYESSELTKKIYPLAVDYDTLNAGITGKFNIAVQTDTHMSKKPTYTSNAYAASDFDVLSAVVGSVNNVEVTLFAHLGDFIRGYQSDPDYESRLTADAMMDVYKNIRTNKAFVIGNHDDGCLFYGNATYNDNKSTSQVMFPNEQFNRYTKYGINNAYTSNYYYKDISGVRIITLWQRDFDYAQSIPEIESFNVGQTQLNWLTGTALNTDLPVIIMCHAPLVSTLYSTSRGGFDAVLTAINAFVSSGGTVIAVLSGHTHSRGADKVDGINHIVFKNGYDFFELVSVDTTNRIISCTLVGTSGDSRTFTY